MRFKRTAMAAAPLAMLLMPLVFCFAAACADETPLRQLKETCSLSSDCNAPLICAFQKCHVECKSSKDCAGGARCVQSQKPYFVCQADTEQRCSRNSECQGTQICARDGQCRDACVSDKDCAKEQICTERVCADKKELVDGGLSAAPLAADAAAGASCNYSSDCPEDLVCREGACSEECIVDKDCTVGFFCGPLRPGNAKRCIPGTRGDSAP